MGARRVARLPRVRHAVALAVVAVAACFPLRAEGQPDKPLYTGLDLAGLMNRLGLAASPWAMTGPGGLRHLDADMRVSIAAVGLKATG